VVRNGVDVNEQLIGLDVILIPVAELIFKKALVDVSLIVTVNIPVGFTGIFGFGMLKMFIVSMAGAGTM
jgi:hypothetical protein